jgi:hypothetical protein
MQGRLRSAEHLLLSQLQCRVLRIAIGNTRVWHSLSAAPYLAPCAEAHQLTAETGILDEGS